MGELKSCLFCGKRVDEAFEYCPYCGYEFGEGDEVSAFGGDAATLVTGKPPLGGDKPVSGGDTSASGGELPGLLGEKPACGAGEGGGCVPEEDEGYLCRLRTLQEILSDLERELDHILAREGEAGPGAGRPGGRRAGTAARDP